jgi:hypothetical protein
MIRDRIKMPVFGGRRGKGGEERRGAINDITVMRLT